MRRTLLGTASDVLTRVRVYLTDDALEIDEIEGYNGVRKRVLFDEVLLVTLDRRRRLQSLLVWGGLTLLFSLPGTIGVFAAKDRVAGLVMLAVLGGPFFVGFLLHLAAGTDHVTVFGKRTIAQMRFVLRKRRAREVFALLRDRVRTSQQPTAAVAVTAPPPPADAGSGGTAAA